MSLHKPWYSIEDAVKKLGLLSASDVYQFLETGQLHAAVRVVKMFSCDTVFDTDGVPDPTCLIGFLPQKAENVVQCSNGFFVINDYIKIDWNDSEKGSEHDWFNLYNVSGRLFEIVDPENIISEIYPRGLTVYRRDLVITAKELDSVAVSSDKVAAPEILHPRIENTLLTIISGLLDVINGDYSKDASKHPDIKNQSQLVLKLVDLGLPGLSKSNLEKYFAKAKRAGISE